MNKHFGTFFIAVLCTLLIFTITPETAKAEQQSGNYQYCPEGNDTIGPFHLCTQLTAYQAEKRTTAAQCTITAKANIAKAGFVTGSGPFMPGDTVKVTATPKNGYRFVRWLESRETVSTSAEYAFTVTKSRALTAEFAAIGKPKLTIAYPSYSKLQLTWKTVTGAAGYEISRKAPGVTAYKTLATTSATTYQDTGLTAGSSYSYRVRVYCATAPGVNITYGGYVTKTASPKWPKIVSFSAVRNGYYTASLKWSAVTSAQGYEVSRSTSSSRGYTVLAKVSGNTYTDQTMNAGYTYYYRVRPYAAVNTAYSYGPYSGVKSVKPAWPTITLTVRTVNGNNLQLGWTNISGADGYEVQRGTKSSNMTAYKDALTNSFTDAGLAKGTYYYKVRAYKVVGSGANTRRVYSAFCTAKSGKANWPVITLAVTNRSYNSLKLDWNDAGATGYNVYRNTKSAEPYTKIAQGVVPSEYIDDNKGAGLTTGTIYYYKIEPCFGALTGPRSEYKTGTPAWPVPVLTVTAGQQNNSLKLGWQSILGARGYDVFRETSSGGSFTVPVNTATITGTEYTDTGLTTGYTYYYKVKPYVMVGASKVYGTASVHKSATILPAAPTGLNLSQVPLTSIDAVWDPVPNATSYEVYRSTSSTGTFTQVATTSLQKYRDKTGLASGKTYHYKVRAYVLVGGTKVYGGYSAPASLQLALHTPYTGPGSWQLTGQIGGTTKALLRRGNTLYIGVGLHIMIFNVTNPQAIQVLGSSPLLPQFAENITGDGNGHLFVSCGSGGLVILDVSNPASASILGRLDTRGYTEGATISGHFAVLADGPQGVQIADISNLANPVTVAEAYPLAYAYDVSIRNNIAYVAAGGSGLLVVDLSNPASPQEKGLIKLNGFQYDAETAGTKLYMAGAWGGVSILDLSTPLEPTLSSTTSTTGWAMALQIQGTGMLVMDGADGAMLYNISGAQPALRSTYTKGGFIVAGELSGNSAFLLDKEKGLMNVDFSNPSSPQLISRWMPILDGRRVTLSGSTGYVAGGLSGMHAINLGDWLDPADDYWYDTGGGYANKVIVNGTTAYLSSHLDARYPMVIFDVSNPLRPTKIGAVPGDETVFNIAFRSMTLNKDHIYIPGEFHDASVDVSDPRNPRVADKIEMTNPINAASSGNLLITTSSNQLQLVDISNPSDMRPISYLAKNTSGEAIAFINPTTVITAADPGVWIVDVSNPNNPQKKAELAVSGSVMDICIDGTTAYLSTLGNGIRIVDISDPLHPALQGSVPTLGLAYDCCVRGDLMLVADSYAGLCIYQYKPESAESSVSASGVQKSLPLLLHEKPTPSSKNGNPSLTKSKSTVEATGTEIPYAVTSAADSGPGTLRDCLEHLAANTSVTFDTSVFDPSSPATIQLETPLPTIIADYITIDASNAGVILDGSELSDGNGLLIQSSHDKIMGLQLLHFPQNGIRVEGSYNQIGGSRNTGSGPTGQGNLTSGNKLYGIHVYGNNHLISGNLVGTDVTGTEAMPNYDGLFVSNWGAYVTVGGTNPGEGNVVSGNQFINMDTWGDHTRIIGNIIGLDITGTSAVKTSTISNLVIESGAMNTMVGGTTPEERNTISGAGFGVVFSDPDSYQNSMTGNYIGTDITGMHAVPNQNGVLLWTSGNHRVGGTTAGEGNLISGNNTGIEMNGYGVTDNIILGNRLGYDSSGGQTLPNNKGISIYMGQSHVILGGYTPEEGNLLSGSSFLVQISNPGITDNYIAGNTFRNGSIGIFLKDHALKNFVQGNTFGNMTGQAVRIDYGTGNEIRGNTFTGEPQNLILLLGNANLDLAAPVISLADDRSVSGTAGAGCLVEVYVIEGTQVTPLGFTRADTEGHFTYQSSQPLTGKQVTALATDGSGNTSVFSSAQTVH